MAVRALRCLAGLPLALAIGSAHAEEAVVQGAPPGRSASSGRPVLGLSFDAGVPDGATAALVLRAAPWLRLHGGGGTNGASAGFRTGLTLVPLGHGPSLSAEVGHYRDGDANVIIRRFVGTDWSSTALFERVAYTYFNGQVGLELGRGRVAAYLHAGVSYVRAALHDVNQALEKRGATADGTRIRLGSDPVLHAWGPSAKLGLVVYLE